jgi:small-conductance mechanosensitive channel
MPDASSLIPLDFLDAFNLGQYGSGSSGALTKNDLLGTINGVFKLPTYENTTAKNDLLPGVGKLNELFGTPSDLGVDGKKVLQGDLAGGISWFKDFQDYFLRAVIIILGFIFVGVGLGMFKAPSIVAAAGIAKSIAK